jgi:hypothetical protein
VDEQGRKVSVRPWVPTTDDQRRRGEQALLRRQLRRDLQSRFDAGTGSGH